MSAQQIEQLVSSMSLADSGNIREKQIEKAQKLLLTKLGSTDYNNHQYHSLMTPEQQMRQVWTNPKTETRLQNNNRTELAKGLNSANIKKVQSFQKVHPQVATGIPTHPQRTLAGDLSPTTLTEYQSQRLLSLN
mgnify:CR=1 FL=1